MIKEDFEKRAREEAREEAGKFVSILPCADGFTPGLWRNLILYLFTQGARWGHAQGCADERARWLAKHYPNDYEMENPAKAFEDDDE